MIISIKSEIDSRVLLYPLMKACNTFGSVLVMSNNKYLKRLIDDQEYSTFKNIAIVVDDLASTDDIYDEYDIAPDDYDYIVVDNMGVASYDKCFCLFGQRQSETFMEDKALMEKNENVDNILFIEFGKRPAQQKASKPKPIKDSRFKRSKGKEDVSEIGEESTQPEQDYNPADKFRDKVEEEKRKSVVSFNVQFPSFEMIENLEGMGKFDPVDETLCKVFYEALGKQLNIQFNNFRKEIRRTNEGGSGKQSGWSGR